MKQAMMAYELGRKYFAEGNYEKARENYYTAAQCGLMSAQICLGEMYYYGDGISVDYKSALYWYEKAAIQGHDFAQFIVGTFYAYGHGVEVNYTVATDWWIKAAEQGNIDAQANLGHCYLKGMGVERDMNKAYEWWLKAAVQGDGYAQLNVGATLVNGSLGHTPTYNELKEAVQWIEKARNQGIEGSDVAYVQALKAYQNSIRKNIDALKDAQALGKTLDELTKDIF